MTDRAWEALRRPVDSTERMGFALLPIVYSFIAWGLVELAVWMPWLTVPLFLAAGFLLYVLGHIVVHQIGLHVRRADTATQTLRAASQGRIEVKGTLRPVTGTPLISPLYGIPCAAYTAEFTAVRSRQERVTLKEEVFPEAVLLSDGDAEAFLPLEEIHRFHTEVELSRPDAPLDWLRADLREQIDGPGWQVVQRAETLIPCDKVMQVNAVFHTQSTADSYLDAEARHLGKAPPPPETREHHPTETLWREYCRRREADAGGDHPVAVDALLSISLMKGIGIVRARDANVRDTAKTIGMALVFLPGALYLFLRLALEIHDWTPLF